MNMNKIEWLWECYAALLDLSDTVLNSKDDTEAPRKAQLAFEVLRRGDTDGFFPSKSSEPDEDSAALALIKIKRLLQFDRMEFLFDNINDVVDKEVAKYRPAYSRILEERAHRETI